MTTYNVNIDESMFNSVYVPYLNEMARTQIYYGGSSSGKSVFLAQRDVVDILKGGRNFLICRQVARTLKRSVFNEIVKVIEEWNLKPLFKIVESKLTITCVNGYQFLFLGLDDTEKIKSITPQRGVITDVRIEEATETQRDDIKQLMKRQRGGDPDTPKRLTLSFNPILKTHWIYQDYFSSIGWGEDQTTYKAANLSILKTWYIHNRFLTESDINDLENEEDSYFFNVYTLGNWGVLGHTIFTNWETRDLSAIVGKLNNKLFGLDFGFNHPSGLVCCAYDEDKNTIFIFDEVYERGMTNDILADAIRDKINGNYVTCDSAEPKSIKELNGFGINAVGARKGADSIRQGIDWLKRKKIIVDSGCINMQNELSLYQWKKNKNGDSMNIPVDRFNHLIDALRYALEDEMISLPALL